MNILTPVISLLILIILMIFMIIFFSKKPIFLIILTIYLFSLIIGVAALEIDNFPFTPYFQVFFILFQTVFLLITSIEVFRK